MISVVIPAYNSAITIAEALESVLAQTLWSQLTPGRLMAALREGDAQGEYGAQPLFEVIIVDDCSTDETVQVVEAWLAKNALLSCQVVELSSECPAGCQVSVPTKQQPAKPKTGVWRLLLQKQNAGPAAARNVGVAMAKGDWIAFLDADDIWFPKRLEHQINLASQRSDVVMWCGQVVLVGENASLREDKMPFKCCRPICLTELAWHNPVRTSTVLIRKTVIESVGGFDVQLRGPEDYDLWMRVAEVFGDVAGIVLIDIPLTQYRLTTGSLSMDDRKFLPQVFRLFDKAFGPGGALANFQNIKAEALSEQYWGGSWMAFNRGARLAAIRLWWKAWKFGLLASSHAKRSWYKMLFRYCCFPVKGNR